MENKKILLGTQLYFYTFALCLLPGFGAGIYLLNQDASNPFALCLIGLSIFNVALLVIGRIRFVGVMQRMTDIADAIRRDKAHILRRPNYRFYEQNQLGYLLNQLCISQLEKDKQIKGLEEQLANQDQVREEVLQQKISVLEQELQAYSSMFEKNEGGSDGTAFLNGENDFLRARMSHELRTPLNAIIGYSELVEENALENGDKYTAADICRIKQAAHHLAGIINNILDYSEIQADQASISKTSFPLDDLVETVASSIQPLAEKNKNNLVIRNHSPEKSIFSDEKKIRQILTHLLSNAAKFTNSGTISLDVWLGDDEKPKQNTIDNQKLVINVNDTGIGIPNESIDTIFHPTKPPMPSYDRSHDGIGLGLVLTQNFVEIMGGSLKVESEQGAGSHFEVMIPLETK